MSQPRHEAHEIRLAAPGDAEAIGRTLDAFNREFGIATPGPSALSQRVRELLAADMFVLLAGERPDGLALLRLRPSLWTPGLECYLAELYVVPERRCRRIGTALMQVALAEARARGADTMNIEVDEPDTVARHLYERLGFSNREGGPEGPLMYVYERAL